MTVKKGLFWMIILAFVAALIVFIMRPKTVEAVQVSQQSISHAIVATGRMVANTKVDLSSQITAPIDRLFVKEGDNIQTGQLLVTLKDNSLLASLAQAEANLLEAERKQAELQTLLRPQAQLQLQQAKANLLLAQQEHDRLRSLQNKNLAAQSQLDQAIRTLQLQQSALESAQLQLQALQPQGISSQLIDSRLQQAKANLALAQAKAEQLTLRAPFNGTVLQRLQDVGSMAQPSKAILSVAESSATRIEVAIDEKNLTFIRLGQTAEVIADAYPNQPFPATITLIYPSIDANRATITVRLETTQAPSFFRPDMTVSIRMQTQQQDNALVLPSDAIQELTSEHPWVWIIEDGKAKQQAVRVGIQGIGHSQIIDGLAAGEWVITQSGMKAEQRVTPTLRSTQRPRGFDVPSGIK